MQQNKKRNEKRTNNKMPHLSVVRPSMNGSDDHQTPTKIKNNQNMR